MIDPTNLVKKVDFLFVYEVKLRELENICLLKYELEKRGYSVGYVNTWSSIGKDIVKIDAEVVITFAAYDDATVKYNIYHVGNYKKILNMQWEQLLLSNVSGIKEARIKENAKKIWHVSWGNNNREELLYGSQVDSENIKMVGHIGMDFLGKEFRGFYHSKSELTDKYNLPNEKKVCLFISSFSYMEMPQTIMTSNEKDFINIAKESQSHIIEWMSQLLKDRNIVVVYRPHPAEILSQSLREMEDRSQNFRIISEMSVKQWILIADYIMTWYSTSIAEVYFAKRKCCILRPIEIPRHLECSIYEKASFITSYKDLLQWSDSNDKVFPMPDSEMQLNYANDEIPVYLKLVDVLVELYKSDKDDSALFQPNSLTLPRRILRIAKLVICRITKGIEYIISPVYREKLREEEKSKEKFNKYVEKMSCDNAVTDKEIKSIINRLDQVLTT